MDAGSKRFKLTKKGETVSVEAKGPNPSTVPAGQDTVRVRLRANIAEVASGKVAKHSKTPNGPITLNESSMSKAWPIKATLASYLLANTK